jgi:hypothetical protein
VRQAPPWPSVPALTTSAGEPVFFEMNFALVPDDQPPVSIDLFNDPDESDPGPYPIPANLPVETWPRETGTLTLVQWQQDVNNDGAPGIVVLSG